METLLAKSAIKLQRVSTQFMRDALVKVTWADNRLIGIKGARGVGKTTLVLQYLKLSGFALEQALYVSLDDLYFSMNRLYDLGASFTRQGGLVLVLDEVHRYANWSQEIKNLYDDFPDLRIIFTGSSIIHLERGKGDLSRRAVMYQLPGLSFREFLRIQQLVAWSPVSLTDLLERHTQIAADLTASFKPLAHWADYLKHGYYPYFLENKEVYSQKLTETIALSLEIDLPSVYGISYATVDKLKQLLVVLAESVPLKPNISKLSEQLHTTRGLVVEYMHYLEELGILLLLHRDSFGVTRLQKPEKVYLSHPNVHYALHQSQPNKGTIRESFLLSQIHLGHQVEYTEDGDFKIDRQITIEVGGASKNRRQLTNIEQAYVAANDIEVGYGRKIPLWLFGLLY
ncbi:AAA family ATPase [Spirosoma montaniterrae]|uniref:AAA family ATPase n=2 Tax=Spirosoma montaniterrae TaxID=1178516 RepID=A0A1P9X4V9_9BACT|nr:AAA family ATPase [Spirosoma montaniterrae]